MTDSDPGTGNGIEPTDADGAAVEPTPAAEAVAPVEPTPAAEPVAAPESAGQPAAPAEPPKPAGGLTSRLWVAGLVVVALLVGVLSYVLVKRDSEHNGGAPTPTGAVPTLTESAPASTEAPVPVPALAAVSVVRDDAEVTLTGTVPDVPTRQILLDAVVGAFHEVTIVDNMQVEPGVQALNFAASPAVFNAAADITDFSLKVAGDTVTLAGTADSTEEATRVEEAAVAAWPGINIVNTLTADTGEAPEHPEHPQHP